MRRMAVLVTLSARDYDAVLFDLDGVLTPTAAVHARAWQRLFDDFLREHAAVSGTPFVPFDVEDDYRRHVDGKPRADGVRDFLAARGIALAASRLEAMAEQKDAYFTAELERQGVQAYPESVALVRALRAAALRTAVVSSSRNCAAVLEAAGITGLFDARVDGMDALPGKPAPDAFLEGARRLGCEPARAVVVEDSIAGVAAGCAGGFGLVIGVDRVGHSHALRAAGADAVVCDLGEVALADERPPAWTLAYHGFDAAREGVREALCALGNGFFTTRGAACWAHADGVHYPGTYVAGGYNRMRTAIAGREVENEDLVNLPNWLAFDLRFGDGEWFTLAQARLLDYRQELDLRRGVLSRKVRFEDGAGKRTTLSERRLVSMAEPHLAALELTITPENWSGEVTLRSGIDGGVVNAGARLYRKFNNRHLAPDGAEEIDGGSVLLGTRTSQSNLRVVEAARLRIEGSLRDAPRLVQETARIAHEVTLPVAAGVPLRVEKTACLFTSRDAAISEPVDAARKAIGRAPRFGALFEAHVLAWKHLWRRFDIHLRLVPAGYRLNLPMLLRLHMFHLLQAASPNSIGLDIGVPPRGLTGEAYQGHIFWDEIFIFPFLNWRMPEITRSLLMYRFRRLAEARAAAAAAGYRGAMFPWQSGSDGQEETQELNYNDRSGRWVRDNTWLQRHVGSAVAWNTWQYFQVTGDIEFLQAYGAEMMLEIARFWSSLASFDASRGRYVIRGVMGPDEFHDAYPGAAAPGIDNNAYTNVMAVWVVRRALELLELLPEVARAELAARLEITGAETARWEDMGRRMFVPFHGDGIPSQFEGYERLAELDWDGYRARYGNIQRLELILEAEGDSANRYKACKQADVLMLLYLFSADELRQILGDLGYALPPESIPRIVDYYESRSTHGSTLSNVVHAWVLARSDRRRAMRCYAEALQSDVADIQGGTTAEGVHLGAMAGTVDLVQRVATGLEATGGVLRLDPHLPEELQRLHLRIRYRGQALDLRLTRASLTVRSRDAGAAPIRLAIGGEEIALTGGETRVVELSARPGAQRALPRP